MMGLVMETVYQLVYLDFEPRLSVLDELVIEIFAITCQTDANDTA